LGSHFDQCEKNFMIIFFQKRKRGLLDNTCPLLHIGAESDFGQSALEFQFLLEETTLLLVIVSVGFLISD